MVLTVRDSVGGAVRSTEPLDVQLWLLVLASMAADILLTLYGLRMGLVETNPIAIFGIETVGYAVLAYLKVPALLLGVVGWIVLPTGARRLNLIGLSLPWAGASLFNLWLILGTV